MRNLGKLAGGVLAAIALAVCLAPVAALADEAVSFGGEGVEAGDQVYLGSWDGVPIAWDVESASGGSAAVHSHYILFDSIVNCGYEVGMAPGLTLATSDLYTQDNIHIEDEYVTWDIDTLPGFAANAFSTGEKGVAASPFALSGDFGGVTNPDGSDDWCWIAVEPTQYEVDGDYWWRGTAVDSDGERFTLRVDNVIGVRPASSFDLKPALFSSAAKGGKSGAAAAGAFSKLSGVSSVSAWKLTLKDSSRTITASASETTADKGYTSWSIPVVFSGGGTGANDYVSAILCDSKGNALYYSTVAKSTASGKQDMSMPTGLAVGSYTLKVFSEQRNGDFKTDYAGDFVEIALTVKTPAPPAPTPAETATLAFDLAGGKLDGKTGTIAIEASSGVTMQLPAAPQREGFSFICWSEQNGSKHAADALYKVSGDSSFVAKWAKKVEPSPGPKPDTAWTRLAGADRFGTMQAITLEGYESADTVLVATGIDFADALAAAGLSGVLKAPIVTTMPGELSAEARDAITQLGAKEAIILGGTSAVSANVEKQLKAMGLKVERLAGDNRVDTAVRIWKRGGDAWGGTCILSKGWVAADALAAGSFAYAGSAPLFLALPDGTLTPDTAAAIKTFDHVVVLGGTGGGAAISDKTAKSLGVSWMRVAGDTRYETATALATWASGGNSKAAFQPAVKLTWNNCAVAFAWNYPDALVGVNVTGPKKAVTLLASTDVDEFTQGVSDVVKGHAAEVTHGYVLGGKTVVSDAVLKLFESAAK